MSLVTEINALVTRIATEIKGKANAVHTHAASDINSGTLSTARMGTGTANSTKVLYGDGTWRVPYVILNAGDPVPGGLAEGTLIIRRA